jgi:very-short-patch-repair endonuclease
MLWIRICLVQLRRDANERLTRFARAMRAEPTDAERKLWSLLRFKALEGYRFRRQRPVAGYILDFYCPAKRLAIELDGGQHSDARQARYDQIRSARLNKSGVRVLRFWDDEVLKHPDAVAEEILRELEAPSPHPIPPPEYQGRGNNPGRLNCYVPLLAAVKMSL